MATSARIDIIPTFPVVTAPQSDRESIPLQPHPTRTRVSHRNSMGQIITAIARTWEDGDEARCRLCDECDASEGMCLVQVVGRVVPEDAALFSTIGMRPHTPG